MTVVDNPASLTRKDPGRHADRLFWALCVSAGLAVLLVLGLILASMLQQSLPALTKEFFTSSAWVPNDPDEAGPLHPQYGSLTFLYGTVIVSVIALVVAVPVSLGIALFLTELAPRRVRSSVVLLIDMLAAVPSVVFGLWGIIVVAPALVPVYEWLHDTLGGVPVIGSLFGETVSSGRNFMTAGLIVAVMIIPIITSISREVFATVPNSDKQAAYALGATRWEMIKGAVLPHSFGGVVGAVILGLGRAMGETIAVALVIGSAVQITPNLLASGYALPAVIVNTFGEASGDLRAALIGMGVVLFILTVGVNLLARFVVRRAEIRMKGAPA
ncbi:phosphate ABC transporter permease subunit PstC [Catellatospora tritici]|uniref:phosphate ABC transporter permease subunit PstC n=1 Tax=Catellatospora tritici TaxID=2851566 RepID=UPI001C2D3D36|nr:phosphate ABC transporter permease subunit PstC [Catellatospora tritici]MBV1855420.1 phosphate ABC transporter permease subunit PstC [Catellatospora tritici]